MQVCLCFLDYSVSCKNASITSGNLKKIKKRELNRDGVLNVSVSDEDLSLYLEEVDHLLFGSNTPMFISKVEFISENDTEPNIVFDRVYYVRKLQFYKKTKRKVIF